MRIHPSTERRSSWRVAVTLSALACGACDSSWFVRQEDPSASDQGAALDAGDAAEGGTPARCVAGVGLPGTLLFCLDIQSTATDMPPMGIANLAHEGCVRFSTKGTMDAPRLAVIPDSAVSSPKCSFTVSWTWPPGQPTGQRVFHVALQEGPLTGSVWAQETTLFTAYNGVIHRITLPKQPASGSIHLFRLPAIADKASTEIGIEMPSNIPIPAWSLTSIAISVE